MKPRVCRARRKDGSLYATPIWETFDSNGQWSGSHETWDEAMRWTISVCDRLEYWLARQAVSK